MLKFLRNLVSGNRFINSLLTGDFDESPTGRHFAAWFKEDSKRSEQRASFVALMGGMGCPPGVIADRIMGSITKVWKHEGARFGECLAEQVDEMIVFDTPTTAEQVQQQNTAREMLGDFKKSLIALDNGRVAETSD